jgi:hypothetical protein
LLAHTNLTDRPDCRVASECGCSGSLSRRERAGVRENGVQIRGLAIAINSITIIKSSKD